MEQYSSKASSKSASNGSKGMSAARSNSRGNYVHGTAVRKTEVEREIRKVEKVLGVKPAKRKRHITKVDVQSMAFMICMVALVIVVLLRYLKLVSSINSYAKEITRQEKELYDLRMKNDEDLAHITNNIDYEEIRRIAIAELGMTYPDEDQLMYYEVDEYDYFRKID